MGWDGGLAVRAGMCPSETPTWGRWRLRNPETGALFRGSSFTFLPQPANVGRGLISVDVNDREKSNPVIAYS